MKKIQLTLSVCAAGALLLLASTLFGLPSGMWPTDTHAASSEPARTAEQHYLAAVQQLRSFSESGDRKTLSKGQQELAEAAQDLGSQPQLAKYKDMLGFLHGKIAELKTQAAQADASSPSLGRQL